MDIYKWCQCTHTQICCQTLQPQRWARMHKNILCFMEDCRFILPSSVFSKLQSNWNSTTLRAAGVLLHISLSASSPLWASWSVVHQEVRSSTSYKGYAQSSHLSITAQVSQIYDSIQAAWGCRLMPNVANHGIHPANSLLMQFKHTAEHSNADCASSLQRVHLMRLIFWAVLTN